MEHSKFGYSAVNEFKTCPFKYDLNWNKHLQVIDDYEPTNALKIGTALHKAIETDFETAAAEYYKQFNVIDDRHVIEMMKVEIQSEKVKKMIEGSDVHHETKIEYNDFIGTIDLLEDLGNGNFNMYDFKYTNNIDNYRDSPQLNIYRYYFEKTHPGYVIERMFFIIVPKSNLKRKDDENISSFKKRLFDDLKDPIIIESMYSDKQVEDFFSTVKKIKNSSTFPKHENKFCWWCIYKDYCQKGDNTMLLPSNERRNVGKPTKRKIWIYGPTMSGKTTLLDSAPNPLNLNTDGNIQFVTMPYLSIKDDIKVEGRITKTTLAWQIFKDAISELEKNQNDFNTIIVDLLEDTYESCRIYMYDKLGITHESDDSFRAWDKVRTEYLSTIRRFFNLDYENLVVVSHEDMSKDITKKSGDKVTSIKPNIPDKVANKIAGMVDIVARVVVEDDGSRTLNFKSNEVIFGGGRLKNLEVTQIPLDWNELMKVYDTTEIVRPKKEEVKAAAVEADIQADIQKAIDEAAEVPEEPVVVESPTAIDPNSGDPMGTPKRRTRRVRN